MNTSISKIIIASVFIILANSFSIFAQQENFILENENVIFQKIFILEGLGIDEVEATLNNNIPKITGIKDYTIQKSTITAKIANKRIDCSKYLSKKEKPGIFLNYPFEGQVIIDWKEGRYRLTIKDLMFFTQGFGTMELTALLTKSNRKEFRNWDATSHSCSCINSYFTELFTLNKSDEW